MLREQNVFHVEIEAGFVDHEQFRLFVGFSREKRRTVLIQVRLYPNQRAHFRILQHNLVQMVVFLLNFAFAFFISIICLLRRTLVVFALLRDLLAKCVHLLQWLFLLLVNSTEAVKDHINSLTIDKLALFDETSLFEGANHG